MSVKYVLNNCEKCYKELARLDKETEKQAVPIVVRLWCSDFDKKTNSKTFCIETFRKSKQLDNLKKQGALEELRKLGKFIDDWYSVIDGERLTKYYAKRIRKLKEVKE